MKCKERHYSEIKAVDRNGITFEDGTEILFSECAGLYDSETCVAERDVTASPPYFSFGTPDQPTKILFDRKGVFSAYKNRNEFRSLELSIIKAGYKTFDLS